MIENQASFNASSVVREQADQEMTEAIKRFISTDLVEEVSEALGGEPNDNTKILCALYGLLDAPPMSLISEYVKQKDSSEKQMKRMCDAWEAYIACEPNHTFSFPLSMKTPEGIDNAADRVVSLLNAVSREQSLIITPDGLSGYESKQEIINKRGEISEGSRETGSLKRLSGGWFQEPSEVFETKKRNDDTRKYAVLLSKGDVIKIPLENEDHTPISFNPEEIKRVLNDSTYSQMDFNPVMFSTLPPKEQRRMLDRNIYNIEQNNSVWKMLESASFIVNYDPEQRFSDSRVEGNIARKKGNIFFNNALNFFIDDNGHCFSLFNHQVIDGSQAAVFIFKLESHESTQSNQQGGVVSEPVTKFYWDQRAFSQSDSKAVEEYIKREELKVYNYRFKISVSREGLKNVASRTSEENRIRLEGKPDETFQLAVQTTIEMTRRMFETPEKIPELVTSQYGKNTFTKNELRGFFPEDGLYGYTEVENQRASGGRVSLAHMRTAESRELVEKIIEGIEGKRDIMNFPSLFDSYSEKQRASMAAMRSGLDGPINLQGGGRIHGDVLGMLMRINIGPEDWPWVYRVMLLKSMNASAGIMSPQFKQFIEPMFVTSCLGSDLYAGGTVHGYPVAIGYGNGKDGSYIDINITKKKGVIGVPEKLFPILFQNNLSLVLEYFEQIKLKALAQNENK